MQKVCIVIPFYNGDEYIDACLRSLSLGSCAQAEKIVVNNSDKPTKLRDIAGFYENVTVIDTEPRIGFGRACNEGAKLGILRGAQYIIVLNQDSIAHEDLVSELINPFAEAAELVLTAPILYDYAFSSIEGFFIRHYLSRCPDLFYDALSNRVKTRYKVDCVCGACFAIRSEFINRYGLFDPIYFMYEEDDDLCRRIGYTNYDIAMIPGAKVAHYHSHVNICKNDKMRIQIQNRHSLSIYQLKDVHMPILESCIRVCCRNTIDYIKWILSLKMWYVLNALITDSKLVIKLPYIIRSRNAEMDIAKKVQADRQIENALGRPTRGIEKPCDDSQ